ncbi:MAG TPA: glutaredoxin domain-containing protein [Candidatus Poseidoniaceae archaeon]|nr:glutaredoxin domain-containing protein [Candidatus Poseidoniaceae archaeon]
MAKVELYTNRGCGACVNAKRLLDSKKVNYVEKKLGSSKRIDAEFHIRTNGSKTIPQIFIDDEWIGGFEELLTYENANELDWRLGLSERPHVSLFARILRTLTGKIY